MNQICVLCKEYATNMHEPDLYDCENCKTRQVIFENDDSKNCVKKFIDFVETYKSKDIYCIAHNFKGYDSQFIITELFQRSDTVQLIMAGKKIMKIIYKSFITFIDSLNFLPMSLSKFPDAFGFENVSKGYYPHLFNTLANKIYIGNIPLENLFGIENFTEQETKKFMSWYTPLKNDKNYVFDNDVELKNYCALAILRKGCVKFMTDFCNIVVWLVLLY